MGKIKIFVIYHQDEDLIKSDMFQPILTGAYEKECPAGMIGDHTDDNISKRNTNYGEFTAHYWVMKNYLPQCEEEYIGFCHYRRFFDWNFKSSKKNIYSSISSYEFMKQFKYFNTEKIYNNINNYDIILPHKRNFKKTLIEQYCEHHPIKDMENAITILKIKYPEYSSYVSQVLNDTKGYFCLNFTMKKKFTKNFITWSQEILDELYKTSDYSEYTTYNTIRTPAYIMERLFNVWLAYQIAENKVRVLEVPSYRIVESVSKLKKFKKSCRKRVQKVKSLWASMLSYFAKNNHVHP